MTALFGGSLAASAETVTEGFDTFQSSYGSETIVLPEDWYSSGSVAYFVGDTEAFVTARPSIQVEGANTEGYLVTPVLSDEFSFYLKNRTKNYQASVKVYSCTYADGQMTLGELIGEEKLAKTTGTKPEWKKLTYTASTATRIALLLSQANFDDFTYTPFEAAETATLVVSGFTSGSTFDFGTVPAGTTQTFLLSNNGKQDLAISSIAVTGDFALTAGADLTTIAAKGSAQLTIATPAKDAEGALTITSNDANSPYVINLTSTYKVPAPIMAIDMTEVAFGNVTDDASQVITVSNTGDAELIVNIKSSNADFFVSDEKLTVAAGESKTFTITYYYHAENYGGHVATITVTPNVGEVVKITASASIKDPNAWSEDFSAGTLPEDWEIIGSASTWAFEDGEAKGTYNGSGNWLVTPRLTVKDGESLTFQARSRQYGSDIIVEGQKDDGAWKQLIKEGRNTQNEFETYTISGLEAGTYRFRIATENINLDNFEGFQQVPSTVTKETWHISYAFHYMGNDGEVTETDEEPMVVEFDGDNLAFNFPNPINGSAKMRGSKYQGEGPTCFIFPNGQYIGKYGSDDVYYCGANGNELVDMTFFYDEEQQAFYNFEHILINGSQTVADYWAYFSDVVIYKDQKPTGIQEVKRDSSVKADGMYYNLNGQRVSNATHGLYIINGKKVVIK